MQEAHNYILIVNDGATVLETALHTPTGTGARSE